ncbi:hypothetical protein VNO77_17885 [Canavalia gladiata]|uniref:Uncharacterized protein n=1 Tax=Canavalia gladiata TaxID=3824 RepID=A0AAN9LJV4_CANGL
MSFHQRIQDKYEINTIDIDLYENDSFIIKSPFAETSIYSLMHERPDFSAQNLSLSLSLSLFLKVLCCSSKGACLACASNDLKREGQIKRSSPVLIYPQLGWNCRGFESDRELSSL